MIKEKIGCCYWPRLRRVAVTLFLSNKKIKAYGFDINHEKILNLKKNISYISDLTNNQLKIIDKKNYLTWMKLTKLMNVILSCYVYLPL